MAHFDKQTGEIDVQIILHTDQQRDALHRYSVLRVVLLLHLPRACPASFATLLPSSDRHAEARSVGA